MIKIINQFRTYHKDFTKSELYLPGFDVRFCHVLEDKRQPLGVKVAGMTCIPEGVLDVSVSESTRFKKEMLLLSNMPDLSVQKDGIRFDGIRPHGGVGVHHTEGCPLTMEFVNDQGTAWGRKSDEILAMVKEGIRLGYKYKWVISS